MWRFCALLVALFPVLVFSLFEDQVGNHDWHQSHVGAVSFISLDPTVKSYRGVVVGSDTGVLGVLDPHDGSLRWRQVYESLSTGNLDVILRSKFDSLLTVSRKGQVLRSWDINSGHLKYEVATSLPPPFRSVPLPLSQRWRPGGVQAALAGKKGGVVVVASGSRVTGFVSRSGEMKWRSLVKIEGLVSAVLGEKDSAFVLAVQRDQMEVTKYNSSNGEVLASYLLAAPWIDSPSVNCLLCAGLVWCLDWSNLNLHSASLTDTPSFQSYPLHSLLPSDSPTPISLEPASSPEEVWLRTGRTDYLLSVQEGGVSVSMRVEGLGLVGVSEGEMWDVGIEKSHENQLSFVYMENGIRKVGGVYTLEEDRGRPVKAALQLHREDQSVTFGVAVVMEDDSIIMFGSQEGRGWVREDGLGTVSTVQFLDLPADQSAMVENFLDQTRAEVNPIKLALLRWQLQAQLLKEFIKELQRGDLSSLLNSDSVQLVRDQFNTRKIIVAVTAKTKLYGLDTRDGGVVWQQFLPWLQSPLLYILRSTSHPLHPPLAVLIGRSMHPSCPEVALMAFNPLTGSTESSEPTLCLPALLQTFLLPKEDRSHSKILLFLTRDLEVMTYPTAPEVTFHLTELKEQLFFYVADKEAGKVKGYYISNDRSPSSDHMTLHASHLWHISFPNETERIVNVVHKEANEHVSAVGRSRVDRSIQYKYLNPNLVAVITESTDALRPAVSIYLVDVVTGSVIFHTSHKAAVAPVHLVLSENWMVYQFLNSKLRRHELVVVEMFEGDTNLSRSVWSSLTPPPPPQTLSQAYAVPTAFVTMATTQTRRGITAKSILVGLESGHVAGIPKTVLDPRREVEVTEEMREANLPPYVPEMRMTPLIFINYNQTVGGLRSIYSTASGLESTSLVLACGLDLYFTRVLPSKQFDLLAVDFDYYLIAVVVGAMVIATLVLSRLSTRKSLALLWK